MPRQDVKVRRASPYSLVYSTSADRSSPLPLDRAENLAGAIYVFITPATDIDSVDFYGVEGGGITRSDSVTPFDLVGGAGSATALVLGVDVLAGNAAVGAVVRAGGDVFSLLASFSCFSEIHVEPVAAVAAIAAVTASVTSTGTHATASPSVVASTAAVLTPATTVPPPNLKGDATTSTVEPWLLSASGALWVATFDDPTSGAAAWGSGFDENDGRGGAFTSNVAYVIPPIAQFGTTGKAMRIRCPLSHSNGSTGYGIYRRRRFEDLPQPVEAKRSIYMRYSVLFPTGFKPYDGGKLPSLFGQPTSYPLAGLTGMSSADVYNEYSWWAGMMFIGPSSMTGTWPNKTYSGDSNLDHIRFQPYIYCKQIGSQVFTQAAVDGGMRGWNVKVRTGLNQDPTAAQTSNGTGSGAYFYLSRGTWHTVEQQVVINDSGLTNGIMRIWLDGTLVFNRKDIKWANDAYNATAPANCIMDDTFFGGPSSNADQQDIYIDDMVFSTSYVGPRTS